ncbi:MAG: DUF1631 family protein [Pseudomonadota bacterium]
MEPRVETRSPASPAVEVTGSWGKLSQPLRECGEIAVLRLSGILADALEQAEQQLFKDATEALTHVERESLISAADFSRTRRSVLVIDFMKHFQQRYVRACEHKPDKLIGNVIDFDEKELKIVEHHVLDDSLEPGKIKEAVQNAGWRPLQTLLSQYKQLLDAPDLLLNDLPLGPRIVETAVADAIRDQHWPHQAKRRLVLALCWGLAARINLFYRDLADHLSAKDLRALARPAAAGIETVAPAVPEPQERRAEPDGAAAQEAARREVARCLAGASVPQIIHGFLSSHWRPLLARLHARFGADGPAWIEAVRTMEDLLWSLGAKTVQADRIRLIEIMPGLLKRLDMGLEALGTPRAARDGFFVELAKLHAEVVRLSLEQPAITDAAPPTAGTAATEARPAEPPTTIKTAPVAPATDREAGMRTDGTPTTATLMAGLGAGTWLVFQEPGEAPRELKLAWISPHRGLFLLTNRQGQRALSLSAEAFAKVLEEGRARVLAPTDARQVRDETQAAPFRKTG